MKKLLILLTYIVVISGFILLMAFSRINNIQRLCPNVDIDIDYGNKTSNNVVLLLRADVENQIKIIFDTLKGKRNSEINIEIIENSLKNLSYVKSCDIFKHIDGEINISIVQRQPIVRVYGISGKSFYIDKTGTIMPIREAYPARVLIVNGFINDVIFTGENIDIFNVKNDSLPGIKRIREIFILAKTISEDAFFKDQITQVFITTDNEIQLIPLVGNQIIVMTTFTKLPEKLAKLFAFYTQGLKKSGWEKYNKINIEYKDQVVCTKI